MHSSLKQVKYSTKYRNGHSIPAETPERVNRWLLQAKRMLSANLCRQVVPPAPLQLGNVLLTGPQNSRETTALLSLILDDPKKSEIKKKILEKKSRIESFSLFLWTEGKNGR